jgi:hypothetical protein
MTINFDGSTIIENANIWIPVVLTILAAPFGIRFAVKIVQYILNEFVKAF